MAMLEAGKKAPGFRLSDQNGTPVKLSDFAGKAVVLYFYPKDFTPGCTLEACDFRDENASLKKAGAVVLGVSPDSAERHGNFASKFKLPFTLLADTDHSVAEAYGAWGKKSMMGRKYMGIIRSTFLIGPDGVVARVWPKVKVAGHVEEVQKALSEL